MAEDVQLKQLPAQLALVVRARATTGTIMQRMWDAYGALMRHAEATGAQFVGPPFARVGRALARPGSRLSEGSGRPAEGRGRVIAGDLSELDGGKASSPIFGA